jgi:hypothetical protein
MVRTAQVRLCPPDELDVQAAIVAAGSSNLIGRTKLPPSENSALWPALLPAFFEAPEGLQIVFD